MKHFQKISGYKVISKCRNCGKRIVGKSETYYCDDCLAKLRAYREREAAREEAAKAAAKKKAPTKRPKTARKRPAAKQTAAKRSAKR